MYSVPLTRAHPGAIILLLDQSLSMEEPYGAGNSSKAEELARVVNRLIRALVMQCERGDEIRDYYLLGLIGYGGDRASSIFKGELAGQQLVPISAVADYPLRMEVETLSADTDLRIDRPIWVVPTAKGGTPMNAAIDQAGAILVSWANENPGSFPPIVVNVSDGMATDKDPRELAAQLRDIRTSDGNLLFFNVFISDSTDEPIEYPSTSVGLPDRYSLTLFEMSSELTPYMRAAAENMGLSLPDGARGFMFNADQTRLSEFLDVGTRVSVGER